MGPLASSPRNSGRRFSLPQSSANCPSSGSSSVDYPVAFAMSQPWTARSAICWPTDHVAGTSPKGSCTVRWRAPSRRQAFSRDSAAWV
jgi:hypothetical protein